MARKLPEYNASSLADIAFMLLIFFLVTTTMDVDSGLERRLPPPPPKEQEEQPNEIKERNIFVVLLNAKDQLLVEGEPMRVDILRERAKEFLANPNNSENLPEKKVEEVPFFGPTEITKGVISLQNDNGTSYGAYIAVQNELVGAINELRDEISQRKFGKAYADLEKDQQKAVRVIYPQKISEAEPKNIGKKK